LPVGRGACVRQRTDDHPRIAEAPAAGRRSIRMDDQVMSQPDRVTTGGAFRLDTNHYMALVAHELRDPLTPILNAAAVMKDGPADPERTRRCADIISRQARHMMGIIEDLMHFSRMQDGQLKLQRARVSMAEIVRRAVETAQPFCQQRRQRLKVAVAAQPMIVDADIARLTQTLRNLIVNASKFSAAGSEIEVGAERDGSDVLTIVRDSGIGIGAADLEAIFTLFTQRAQDHVPQASGGLGIGLYLARQFAEAHGGSLRATSPGIGKGSTFTLRIPAFAGTAQGAINTPSGDQIPASPRHNTRRTASRAGDDPAP
jgi:signal transduction histidine kinase